MTNDTTAMMKDVLDFIRGASRTEAKTIGDAVNARLRDLQKWAAMDASKSFTVNDLVEFYSAHKGDKKWIRGTIVKMNRTTATIFTTPPFVPQTWHVPFSVLRRAS